MLSRSEQGALWSMSKPRTQAFPQRLRRTGACDGQC